jgi:trans-aconitate 2-methyltransferase
VATIPVASAGNRLRILLRRAWRAMPVAADRVALAIARRVHPDFPAAMLQDRIPYLRLVPSRLHGSGFSAAMTRCRLDKIADEPWGSPSILKLEHRLVVWQRRD